MNKKGAIIIVEDDKDDQELFDEVFKELNYKMEVIFMTDGRSTQLFD
jgi:CheY-like chemotaxis protein